MDSGKFDWTANDKFPGLTRSKLSWCCIYGGSRPDRLYYQSARAAGYRRIAVPVQFLVRTGNAHLRVERHSENALKVAQYLESHEAVEWVSYAGSPSHPSYELAKKYLPKGQGAILTFGIKGGARQVRR